MRPVSLPATFVLWFIAPDDRAIGNHKNYSDYLKTGDELLLEIKEGKTPAYYFFHPISDERYDEIRSTFGDEDENAPKNEAREIAISALKMSVLRESLCGCLRHTRIVGEERGRALLASVSWDINTKAPEGLVEDILANEVFTTVAFNYLLVRSVITDDEKN